MTLLELIKVCRAELSEAKAQLKEGQEDTAWLCMEAVRNFITRADAKRIAESKAERQVT